MKKKIVNVELDPDVHQKLLIKAVQSEERFMKRYLEKVLTDHALADAEGGDNVKAVSGTNSDDKRKSYGKSRKTAKNIDSY